MSNNVEIRTLMKKDERGVQRQFYPQTHIEAVDGLAELLHGTTPVSTGSNNKLASESQDGIITAEMYGKLLRIIEEYEQGKLGGSGISFEKIDNKED